MEIETINGVINFDLTKVTLNDVSGIISNLPVDLDVSVNAKTILYSGLPYTDVDDFCKNSKMFYYISETEANILWDKRFNGTEIKNLFEW